MADGTKIEWADATLNVINGCTIVSPGCEHCYAMRLAATRLKHHPSREGLARIHNGHAQWTGEVRFNEKVLLDPLHWRRPRKIFWNAHGDMFHPKVPDEWIDRCFAVMALTPQHIHQVLTKRPERMRDYLRTPARHTTILFAMATILGGELVFDPLKHPWPLPNVWAGVSVEDQQRADERIPILLDTPAAVRWLSCEPLLGPINLSAWAQPVHHHPDNQDRNSPAMQSLIKAARDELGGGIDWVVVGGESGPGARPMHPQWARSLRDQCAAAGVPMVFKQWGEWQPFDGATMLARCAPEQGNRSMPPAIITMFENLDESGLQESLWRIGKRDAGRLLDGREHLEFPDL